MNEGMLCSVSSNWQHAPAVQTMALERLITDEESGSSPEDDCLKNGNSPRCQPKRGEGGRGGGRQQQQQRVVANKNNYSDIGGSTNLLLATVAAEEEDTHSCEFGTLAEQQPDEAKYDDRSDADDDMSKGRLKFPKDRLYGREKELARLRAIYEEFCDDESNNGSGSCGKKVKSQSVFLGGYSGTGKSALVDEFIRQLHNQGNSPSSSSLGRGIAVTGKCSELKSSEPFYAVSEAVAQLVSKLLMREEVELRSILDNLARSGICDESDDAKTLVDMMPQLAPLLNRDKEQERVPNNSAAAVGTCQDLAYFKLVFSKFLGSICSQQRPLIMFLDDLQWASAATLELIAAFCSDASICFVFIGTYRVNEVNHDHPLVKIMMDVENGSGSTCHHIEVSNLSPLHIGQFIADCVGRSDNVDDVHTLADVVYSKTLGNIFFVMQALEELVRRNALYYDMMTFQWEWGDIGRVDLENYLSNDVVAMVRSKLACLPLGLQKALTVLAYTSNTIDVGTLQALLECEGLVLSSRALTKLLDRAVAEGVLLATRETAAASTARGSKSGANRYQFSHDKVQEAASTLVAPGKYRNQLLVRISRVLADRGLRHPEDDWMLFVAAHHLNSVPRECIHDCNEVARLNVHVAKLATQKAAFPLAIKLARVGVSFLDKRSCWKYHYDLSLDSYNSLARIEYTLGNFNEALEAVDQVLQNASSKEDRASAHDTRISVIYDRDQDYGLALGQCIETLKLYGVHLPIEPSNGEILMEQMKLRASLGNRPLSILTELPIAGDDDSTMKLLQRASIMAQVAQDGRMAELISLRATRIALKQGVITKYLPMTASALGLSLRLKTKYEQACVCADTTVSLLHRFPDEDRSQTARIRLSLLATLDPLRKPFASLITPMVDLHWILISHGRSLLGFIAARQVVLYLFASSLPLRFVLEPKLLMFQNLAADLGRKDFIVTFECMQRFVRNLQIKFEHPATLTCSAFNEEALLSTLECKSWELLTKDVIMFRLQLAYIFDDESVMEDMLEASDAYPNFEVALVREHLWLAYVGLAALTLARRGESKKKKKKNLNWGLAALDHFKRLDRFGSPNARPIFRCLQAVHEPCQDAFDQAILACSEACLINLAAMMNERCAYFLGSSDSSRMLEKEYLQRALWLYSDWGAHAKATKLREQHEFLRYATRTEPPTMLRTLLRTHNPGVTNTKGALPLDSSELFCHADTLLA